MPTPTHTHAHTHKKFAGTCPSVGRRWQEEQRTVLLEKIAEMVAEQLKRHTHVPHVVKFAQQLCATIRGQTIDVGSSGHNNYRSRFFTYHT